MKPAAEKVSIRAKAQTRRALVEVAKLWGSNKGLDPELVDTLLRRLETAPVDVIAPAVRQSDQHGGKRKNRRSRPRGRGGAI